jgi:hypothetical protein
MEYHQRIIIRFLCKERVSPEAVHAHLEAQFENATYSKRRVGRWRQYVRQGCKDLDDDEGPGRPPNDFLDLRIMALLDESHFIRFVRLLIPWECPTQPYCPFPGIAWDEDFPFTLELTPVERQFTTGSHGNLPRVVPHS